MPNEPKKQINSDHLITDVTDHEFDFEDARKRSDKALQSSGIFKRNVIETRHEASLNNEDDAQTVLPCEFCGEGYPPSLLLEHQVFYSSVLL